MNFKTTTIALAVMLACQTSHAQSTQELAAQLKQMQEQLQSLRAELDALKQQKAATPAATPAATTIATPAPATSTAQPSVASTAQPQTTGNTATAAPAYGTTNAEARAPQDNPLSIFGYGELNYSRLKNDATSAVATAKRAVIGIAYRFNDRTRFASEFEVEDAVASASDQGEAEFEQLYVEHDLSDNLSAKMGLFLMPFGYINESHEPTRYYGVTRNLVETAIIPSTWREMGVGLRGNIESTGLRWTAGLTTSFNLSKWPTTGNSDTLASPLAAIHQEGQNANASSPGYYGGLNYDGIPGFNVGGTVFHGGIGQRVTTTSPQTDTAASSAPNASVTLAELHAKWQVRNWELSSVAARGTFNGVANFNAATASANPVPDAFRGWYAQAAYHLWKRGDYSVVPFGRYERVNTAVGFSGLPQGTVIANNLPDNRVWTWGANFYLHPQVVLKADFQRYLNDSSKDRYEFGVGFQY